MHHTFTNILLCILIAVVLIATAMVQQGLKKQHQQLEALSESVAALQSRTTPLKRLEPTVSPPPDESTEDAADFPTRPDTATEAPDSSKIAARSTSSSNNEEDEPTPGDDADSAIDEPVETERDQPTDAPTGSAKTDQNGKSPNTSASDQDSGSRKATDGERDPRRAAVEAGWEQHGSTVTEVIRALLAGRYEAVRDQLTADLRGQMTVDMMESVMTPIRQRHGAFKEVLQYNRPDRYVPAGVHAFRVKVATERDEPLTFSITIDPSGRIAGLMIK